MDGKARACCGGRAATRRPRSRCRPASRRRRELLAMGGELKATFCLVKDGEAILSQHQGDLENAATFDDYRRALALYAKLFDHAPGRARRRPASRISLGQARAAPARARSRSRSSRSSIITPMSPPAWPRTAGRSTRRRCWASCSTGSAGATTARSGAASSCSPTIARYKRLGRFKPVAMLGGAQAAREPWRNLYAHLMAEMGWAELAMNFAELELVRRSCAPGRARRSTR